MFGAFNLADIGQHAEDLKALVTGVLNSIQANEKAVIELKESNVKLTETVSTLVEAFLKSTAPVAESPIDLGTIEGSGESSQRPDDNVLAG